MSKAPDQSEASAARGPERSADAWRAIAVCGLLVVGIFVVFSQTLSQGFLNYDDSAYVYAEPHVTGGLSWSGISWAFARGPHYDWCPLAILSHQLDCQLYGLNPAGHHLTNLLLHAASSVTLFLVLWRMTAGLWPSAMVAALFAFHPLHVESVAWIAERRDVLSGLFFMLTLAAYGEYVRHPRSPGRYLAVAGLFALGLMSKSILVTLPALLLLLDFWPLRRFGRIANDRDAPTARPAPFSWSLVVEKLPLFALALAAAGITRLVHFKWTDPLTFSQRLAGAAVSCVAYLGQLFVPVGLSIFYPHPEAGRPAWQVAFCAVLLLAITITAVIGRRSYPYLFVGWFWFVGMLLPVIELIPVGEHARADRYTYLSQIGLYIALVWGAMQRGASWSARRWVLGFGSALVLAILAGCTWRQAGFWHDSQTLWEHALDCDEKNVTAHLNLGLALSATDERAAIAQYRQAIELGPNERNIYSWVRAQAHNALGSYAERNGDPADAVAHYRQALVMYGEFVPAHLNLGRALARTGNVDEALAELHRSLELDPDNAALHSSVGTALVELGRTDEAIGQYRAALAINPALGVAHTNLAILLAERDEVDEAIAHFRQAIEIEPEAAILYHQLAHLLRKQGKMSEAAQFDERGNQAGRQ